MANTIQVDVVSAEELMLNKESKIDYAKAQAEMAAAIAQLAAIQKLRSKGR